MVANYQPADVADAFVKQYYLILKRSPKNLHKFYQEPSILGWQGPDGVVTQVTTLSGINEKVMSSSYKYCSTEVKTKDSQESLGGGILVSVTGCFTRKKKLKLNFTQTFFLAKQERGFYVLNDILRCFDVSEATVETGASGDVENDQPAPVQNSAPRCTADSATSLDTEAPVENGKVEVSSDLSVSKDAPINAAAPSPPIASDERVVSPATNENEQSVVAPAKLPKASTVVTPASSADPSPPPAPDERAVSHATNANEQQVVAPAKNLKAPVVVAPKKIPKVFLVVTPPSNVPRKATYASMVAKETAVTSPRMLTAASNVQKQAVASQVSIPPAPLASGSPKVPTSDGTIAKAVTSSSPSPYAEARGIYIGGLPYNITKQGIVDVVKQFGSVRRYSDTVQIRRHEDGFCCGFVEFESADAARRAVEVHHVMFGEKEAYITYKRSSYSRGNANGARSPTGGGNRNGDFRGREDGDWTYYSNGRSSRGRRWSSSDDQRPRQGGRRVEIV